MQSLIANSHGKSSGKHHPQQRSRRVNRRSKRRSRLIPGLEMSQLQQRQKSSSAVSISSSSSDDDDGDDDENSHNDDDQVNEDRTSLFMKFELPLSSRLQFVGALSALRILLENEDVFGNVITGTLIENFIADIEKMGNALDDEESLLAIERQQLKQQRQTSNRLTDMEQRYLAESERSANMYNTTTATSRSSSSSMASESIREFAESLVMLAIYPVLGAWSTQTTKQITEMDENTAKSAYYEVLAWLKSSTTVSPIRRADAGMVISALPSSSSTTQPPLTPLSLSSSVSIATTTKTTSPRPLTYAPSDTSSDNEDDTDFSEDDGDDEQYIMSKKVESAAERLGETRRKGEEHDSATVEDMMAPGRPLHFAKLYQGFSGRALMVLRSLIHYGKVPTLPFFIIILLF